MEYLGKINIDKELKKLMLGKPTKLPDEMVVYEWLRRDVPRMERTFAEALGITEING